jgi:hypothetical protein
LVSFSTKRKKVVPARVLKIKIVSRAKKMEKLTCLVGIEVLSRAKRKVLRLD